MRLRVGAATDKGRIRALNEDVYVARAAEGLFVVCDGMGGAPEGEIASRLAADIILREALAGLSPDAPRLREGEARYRPHTSALANAVRASNDAIYGHGLVDPSRAGMGTTMVGAWLSDFVASVAHVGDSRAYLWHRGRLCALTRDHTVVEALRQEELIESADSLCAEEQHALLRALGVEPEVEVDVSETALQPGDYLLLCSDGLTRMVSESIVERAISQLRKPQQICDYLVDTANANGGIDNITVLTVEVVDRWHRRLSQFWKRSIAGAFNAETHPEIR